MYEALVARVRYHIQKANFMGLKEAESTLLLGECADAIEKLAAFKAQITDGRFYFAKDGVLFELKNDPREIRVSSPWLSEPPKEAE